MSFNKKINIERIKVVSFDLDNTLYDNSPVIKKAEKASQKYLAKEFEKQNKIFDVNQYISVRKELIKNNDIAFDNLTYLRQECLKQVCAELHDSSQVVQKATEIFISFRQKAKTPKKINHMIKKLSERFILVSITNGNCDANNLTIGKYFKKNYSPQQGYRAKPNIEMFEKVKSDFELNPGELLHIGDEERTDGLGATNASCQFFLFTPFKTGVYQTVDNFIALLES